MESIKMLQKWIKTNKQKKKTANISSAREEWGLRIISEEADGNQSKTQSYGKACGYEGSLSSLPKSLVLHKNL